LDAAQARTFDVQPGTYMHKDVLNAMKRTNQIFTNEGFEKFIRRIESVQNVWKMLVTMPIPSHHWNNFIGNVFNNALAGVRLSSYERSGTIIRAMKRGTATENQKRIYNAAVKAGVLRQNSLADFMRYGDEAAQGVLERLEKGLRDSKVMDTLKKRVAQPIEDYTRFAHFIDALEKTGSAKFAAQSVRKHLFNYSEMTDADRTIRTIIPFWNWMKNNVPLQIEKLAQNPRFYSIYVNLKEDSQEQVQGKIPDFARDSYIGVGPVTLQPLNLPTADLDGVLSGSPVESLRYTLSSLNPMLKVPFEVTTNRNIFTGRPIDYEREYRDGSDPSAWLQYAANQTGKIGRTAFDASSGNVGEAILNLLNPFGKQLEIKR